MIEVNWHPNDRQLRQFAVTSLFGFALVGFMVWRWSGSTPAAITLASIGAGCFVVGTVVPNAVYPVYVILTTVTLPIGWLLSRIVLRLFFYGVLTPVGLFLRLLGRDQLNLRRPLSPRTYWREHVEPTRIDSYFRQS